MTQQREIRSGERVKLTPIYLQTTDKETRRNFDGILTVLAKEGEVFYLSNKRNGRIVITSSRFIQKV